MSATTRSFARTLTLALLCGAGGVLSCAAADGEPGTGSWSSAISGGEPDSVDSNVFVLGSHRSANEFALCSASLIAPNLLLTARHCVSTVTEQVTCGQTVASPPLAVNTFFASSTQSIDDTGSTFFSVSDISVPSQSGEICGFDLALLTLSTVVPASVATPLVPRIDRAVVRGESYRAVGYGQISSDDAAIAGSRMVRTGLKVDCAPGKCGLGAASSEFVGETGICSGDSGGPALDSTGKVVGVVSRGATGCTYPIYGSVASWKGWLIGVAEQAAVAGDYAPPFWVTTGLSDLPVDVSPDAGSAGASDGGAGAAPSTSFGVQGDKCGAAQDCKAGFGCFSPTGATTDAYCAAFCGTTASQPACAAQTQCQAGVGVCVSSAASSPDSSSCAVSVPGTPSGLAGSALFGLTALGLAGWRRRRAFARRGSGSFVTEVS